MLRFAALCLSLRFLLADQSHEHWYRLALDAIQSEDFGLSSSLLEQALSHSPQDIDTLQLLGSVKLKLGNISAAKTYLSQAIHLSHWNSTGYIANYLEALRCTGEHVLAIEIGKHALQIHPQGVDIMFNLGTIYSNLRMFNEGFAVYKHIVSIDSGHYEAWKRGVSTLLDGSRFVEAEEFLQQALHRFPNDYYLLYQLGITYHSQGKMFKAMEVYVTAHELNSTCHSIIASMAALYQGLGLAERAVQLYEHVIPLLPDDAGVLNNFGALLGTMNRHEEGARWLLAAYEMDQKMVHTLINLASHYQDEADQALALSFLQKAIEQDPDSSAFLQLRMNLLISPVLKSWEQMNEERNRLRENLTHFVQAVNVTPMALDSTLDRVPFYISYHGLNDRDLVERVVAAYDKCISDFVYLNPSIKMSSSLERIQDSNTQLVPNQRIRVGFISKFFGVFEPHGLLLDGVMKYLPRSHFEVICLPILRADGKPLAASVRDAADSVIDIPLSIPIVQEAISGLNLDVLVFADVMGEPVNHFLAHSRLARVQVAFWGNPITSGSKHMDYFVSADCMEHPFRTRMRVENEPYTEQVVLLDGQGIWYYTPESPEQQLELASYNVPLSNQTYDREYFNFSSEWFVFLCPQSVFKMHPLFDAVFRDILALNPSGHVVVTGGRHATWTEIYRTRLLQTLGDDLFQRLHIVPRVSSEKFLGLLKIADVLLHPFPFDGSRTSADGFVVGVPVLTLPTEHLRGRMGAAFYRTMGIPELVAHNMSEYIRIAWKLCTNSTFYTHVRQLIIERTHLIWEDMEVPFGWSTFLSTAAGIHPPSWDEYLAQSGRNITIENTLRKIREENRAFFRSQWGEERYMLEHGEATLPSYVENSQRPRVFNDWLPSSRISPSLIIQRMRRYVRARQLDDAAQIAYSHAATCESSLECILELGFIEYFRGEHAKSFQYCSFVSKIQRQNKAALCCVGVSGIYLNMENETINALENALTIPSSKDHLGIFVVDDDTLQNNLLSALKAFERYDECSLKASEFIHLPSLLRGGALLLIFSTVNWSVDRIKDVMDIERIATASGHLFLPSSRTLASEIKRIQQDHDHLFNYAMECFANVVPLSIWTQITTTLLDTVAKSDVVVPQKQSSGLVLITQYFEGGHEIIQEDLRTALLKNLANPYISEIVMLTEQPFEFQDFPFSDKIKQKVIRKRLTFQTAFQYANDHYLGRNIIVANADIYFDSSLHRLVNSRLNNTIIALLKWRDEGNSLSINLRTDSQDSWIFHSPLPSNLVDEVNFILGAPRCDNRLARVFRDFGYDVINPAFALHSIEVQRAARQGTLYNTKGAVIGPGYNVLLSDSHFFL